jgi:DNA ligase-1
MLLADVVETSRRVAASPGRIEKIDLIAALLQRLNPEEIEPVVAFLSGGARQGKIGAGYAALRDSSTVPAAAPKLEVLDLDRALESFSTVKGRGSDQRKRELLRSLMERSTEPEQRFLIGLLMGELRQGALEGLMLEAVAKASGVNAERLRRAVMLAGDIGRVAHSVLQSGAVGIEQYDVQLFRPIQPMLAQTAEDVDDAIVELGEAALEYKFDGARLQLHKSGEDVAVFSRSLKDVTAAVPEIVEVARTLPGRELILDGEVLSFTPQGRPQPFQVTARRFGRKLDLERVRADLPLAPVWFDLLYVDGHSIMDEPQERRFAVLQERSRPEHLVPHLMTADSEKAQEFLRQALDRGHEGIMAKSPASAYVAGARGQSWLKIKQAHTLDLVVLAAEWGHGRRHGWLSNLHLGARDTENGGFAMLGKTFKGLTDELLRWQTEQFLKIEIARDEYTVYVQPKLVVEIAFNEIQASSRYVSGLALRFARVKRYRPDKPVEESDTFQTVQKLAHSQA